MGPSISELGLPQKRLFFALPCAQPQRRAISQWRRELGLRDGRPVPSENFHLTLLFLGAVNLSQIAQVCAATAQIRRPETQLRITLDRCEVWQRNDLLLLTPTQPPKALGQLAYALQQAFLPLGLDSELKEFRPHLTLSRSFKAPLPEAPSEPDFQLRCDHFALYESSQGRYREIARWPLGNNSTGSSSR